MQKRNTAQISASDLEAAYKLYPRKEGKSQGFKILLRSVKTNDDYVKLVRAIQNYSRLCENEGREKQYMRHWSTFCSHWQDYVNEEDLGLAAEVGLKLL